MICSVSPLALPILTQLALLSAAADADKPPFRCVPASATHILPETTNHESGYFSLCEGRNGRIYVGSAKYGVNSFLVELDPTTGKQRVVDDAHRLCGLTGPPDWIKVADKTAFSARDSCGEVVFKDRLWLLGGWMDSFKDPPRDVWSSADGKEWTLATNEAAWKHSDFPMALVFKNRMWVMGGWHGGRLPHASASNAVWSSADGVTWRQETAAAGWSPRMAAGAVVFKDRMWILGGIQKYYFGNDGDLDNDVWSSADGVKWERATAKAPWAPRAYLGALVHDGKLWVLGGGNYLPGYKAHHDIWSSPDGVHWTQETDEAPWSPRIWFSAAVYRGRLWVLGGWSNNPSRNWNDVWYSKDGKTWTEFKTETIWAARHEHSTYVFQDKLWVVGGHAAPLANDVWRIELPTGWGK